MPELRPSSRLIEHLKSFEGLELRMYRDSAGLWTIGYGHLMTAAEQRIWRGRRMTEEQAQALFRADVAAHAAYVDRYVSVPLTQSMYDALVSLVFNIGGGNFRRSTLLRLLNSGNYQGAMNEFHAWRRAGGRVVPGLVTRRSAEADWFMSDGIPGRASAPVSRPVRTPVAVVRMPLRAGERDGSMAGLLLGSGALVGLVASSVRG